MKDNRYLIIGGVLTMLGAYLSIVQHNDVAAVTVFTISNIFLIYYAICIVTEYCRYLLLLQEETPSE